MGKDTRGSEHPVGKAGRRAQSAKPKEPSEYMKGVYARLVAARVPKKKKALPLDKAENKHKLGSGKPQ